mgnify:CR=1 FL=1
MDAGTYDLSGTEIMTVHPVHRCSLPSNAPQHTVHPVHKKPVASYWFYIQIKLNVKVTQTSYRSVNQKNVASMMPSVP